MLRYTIIAEALLAYPTFRRFWALRWWRNKIPSAEPSIKAKLKNVELEQKQDRSTNVDCTAVCPNNAKPNVSGRFSISV